MEIINLILIILLVLSCIVLIISILMQSSKSAGLSGSITGEAETFFGKGKANSLEEKIARITKIAAGVFMVVAIVMAIL